MTDRARNIIRQIASVFFLFWTGTLISILYNKAYGEGFELSQFAATVLFWVSVIMFFTALVMNSWSKDPSLPWLALGKGKGK